MPALKPDPVTQVKNLKILTGSLVVAGLLIGGVVPVLLQVQGLDVYTTPWGFDIMWLVGLAAMVADFVMAWMFWRQANAIDRANQGLPPRA